MRLHCWRFAPPFFKRALRLKFVERAVYFDGDEPFSAKRKPALLRHIAVDILAPAFVTPFLVPMYAWQDITPLEGSHRAVSTRVERVK